MKIDKLTKAAALFLAAVFVLTAGSSVYAQGRGRGGGNAGGSSRGGGPPATSPGVDRGIFTSDDRSDGRSTRGRDTASERSNGRSDDGIDRARARGENRNSRGDAPMNGSELNRFRGIAKKLGTTPEKLRSQYQAALADDPDLKWGQFVAANVVADNLSGRYPGVTASAILAGYRSGDSLGETLRRLRVPKDEAKRAEKEAKRHIREADDRD
ncbi:MAG: hypothetical protein ACK4S4_05255 [Pyrinomonadaceae bacterium]